MNTDMDRITRDVAVKIRDALNELIDECDKNDAPKRGRPTPYKWVDDEGRPYADPEAAA